VRLRRDGPSRFTTAVIEVETSTDFGVRKPRSCVFSWVDFFR
jgi:hypothetical protein